MGLDYPLHLLQRLLITHVPVSQLVVHGCEVPYVALYDVAGILGEGRDLAVHQQRHQHVLLIRLYLNRADAHGGSGETHLEEVQGSWELLEGGVHIASVVEV